MTASILAALRDSFAPLRLRNFRIYMAGQVVSLIGTWMQVTAQSWVVWEISRAPAALGIVGMLGFAPLLLFGPLAGVLADRLERRRILLFSQVVAMGQALVLAILVQTGTVALWQVYLLAALLGTVAALDLPAQQAFIGDLSGMQQIRRAVVINSMVFQVSRMLGPVLAGAVIAAVGTAAVFWLNGVSFLAVIASLLVVRSRQVRKASTGTAVGEFTEGLRFIGRQPRMQDLLVFTVVVTFFGISAMTIMPAFVSAALRGGADVLGVVMGASGAGALFGTVLLVPLAQRVRRTGLVVAAATVWTGIWLVLLSWTHAAMPAALAMFFGAVMFPVVLTTTNGLIQFMAPPDMRARLVTTLLMVSFGAQPIAALAVGYSAQALGAAEAIRLNGALMAAGALAWLLTRPALRAWEVPAAPAAVAVAPQEARSEAAQA